MAMILLNVYNTMSKIDVINPQIFPENIISGVTLRNQQNFGKFGFTISGNHIDTFLIYEHRKILANHLAIPIDNLKFQKQIHGDKITIIDSKSGISESDAMITQHKGIMLVVSIADCPAVLMYEPYAEVIAAVHSGWRSTNKNIVSKTIDIMIEQYNINPDNILCYISPCAGGDNYEVGEEVAKLFPKSVKQTSESKFLLDLKAEILIQLISKGILQKNIEISDICTISNDKFHSFRRDKENSGRMGAYIMMRDN